MMRVWTGAGYEDLPTIDAADLQYTPAWQSVASGDSTINNPASFGFKNADRAKYGNIVDMNSSSNNWMSSYDPNDPNNFSLLLKSADKEGTRVKYSLQDGKWVPTADGTENWNTSPTWQNYAPLAIMAAPFAASAMGLGSAAGGGAAAADGITMLPASNLFEGATLAANAPTSVLGGAAGGISMAPASNLFEGASMAPNAPASISQAATGAAAGGSIFDKVPAALKNPSTLSSLAKLGGLLAGGALGGAGSQQGQGQTAVAQPIPTMYGGGSSGLLGWGPMGPTETEKRMRQSYLPGLLGGQNPWGY